MGRLMVSELPCWPKKSLTPIPALDVNPSFHLNSPSGSNLDPTEQKNLNRVTTNSGVV